MRASLPLILLVVLAVVAAGCTGRQGAVQEPPAESTGPATTPTTPPALTTPGTLPADPPPRAKPPLPPQPEGSLRQLNVTLRGGHVWPADVTVQTGSTVTWTNEDEVQHKVVLDDGSRWVGPAGEGEQLALTFGEAGTFPYHCELHPGMRGVVRVGELEPAPLPPPPAGSFNVTISGRQYGEAVLRVAPGSTITWTNLDHEPHEVESDAGGFFASPILRQNERFTTTVTRTGTFTYHCDFHQMAGTLIVE